MENWNQDHYFTKAQKAYMLFCGILIALSVAYVTHLYFEYRVVNATWETTFVSPTAFWEGIPKTEWQPVFGGK
tara:strand:+ start:49 stop:267 length:219 start_codon:yes stop_codon:yes gene_type:complete